jgi:hypothetical protein
MIRKRLKNNSILGLKGYPRKWNGKLPNTPAFILGNAPSISNHDISSLKPYFTIGINSAYKLIDPTILLWQDIEFWYNHKYEVQKLEALKYCTLTSDPPGKYYHFKITGGAFNLTKSCDRLYGRGSSAPLAVQLAKCLGCNPIILLGYDCKYSNGKTDFYGNNPYHKPHTLTNCKRGLKWVMSEDHGSTIINCSDNGYATRSLADVLEKERFKERNRNFFIKNLFKDD